MECNTLTQEQMQQTIDQLRANAKGHKKTADKLSAKVSQLTQNLNESEKERMILVSQLNEATSVIMMGAGGDSSRKTKEQSELSKAFCYVVMVFSSGWLLAMGAAFALLSIGVIGR